MRERGFTYVGLLLLVAITSAGLAAVGSLWSVESRREKEAELLYQGEQFTRAIASFRERTPSGQVQRFPRRLEELVDDKRWPTTRRHLRQIPVDPFTGTREWGLVTAPTGDILGVYSLSDSQPLKRANFPPGLEEFSSATSHRDWRFVYTAPATPESQTN